MNFYEMELRKSLKSDFESGLIRVVGDSSQFFGELAQNYPVSGSKIDWAKVPASIERFEDQEPLQIERFMEFFEEVDARFQLLGDIIYVGDSATDFALEASIEDMRRILPTLLKVPQHHYFIGRNYAWCICFTMEGDMGFGFKAS